MKFTTLISLAVSCVFVSLGCAPKLYVIDRQTVLESEASGEFPDLEKSFDDRASQLGPKMLDRSKLKQKEVKQRSYNILNGELLDAPQKKLAKETE